MIFESKKFKKLPSYEVLKVKITKIYLRSFLENVIVNRFV